LTPILGQPNIASWEHNTSPQKERQMKRFQIRRGCAALLCLVALLGFTGCGGGDDDPPENIAGTWGCTFSKAGEPDKQETWNFVQSGQNITGSYTYGANVWPFTGTYVDGDFTGVDTDGWALHLQFEGDSASGTIAGDGETWMADLSKN
jgi:hypothetical protein